jgi:heme-degrading monooxygenase HmoA
MSVLMRHRNEGMTLEQYDQLRADLGDALAAADGFQSHYGVVDKDGALTVVEVWDSEADFTRWYEANVKHHLPHDSPPPEIAEIRGLITR